MNKLFIALIVVLLGVGAGWYFIKGSKPVEERSAGTEELTETIQAPEVTEEEGLDTFSEDETEEAPATTEKVVVNFTDSGFSPAIVTVKKGTTVTFVNGSASGMWVASAVHPTHQLLPGFDQLTSSAKGTTYNYTFAKVGTWKYHNHAAPSFTGSVVVTE